MFQRLPERVEGGHWGAKTGRRHIVSFRFRWSTGAGCSHAPAHLSFLGRKWTCPELNLIPNYNQSPLDEVQIARPFDPGLPARPTGARLRHLAAVEKHARGGKTTALACGCVTPISCHRLLIGLAMDRRGVVEFV